MSQDDRPADDSQAPLPGDDESLEPTAEDLVDFAEAEKFFQWPAVQRLIEQRDGPAKPPTDGAQE